MTSLYIHIPFCKSRCIYCGFYSTVGTSLAQQYVDAVCREMEIRDRGVEPLETIYLGGGTPSQLSIEQLQQLFLYINKVYDHQAKEVTIEVNPDDVTAEYAKALPQLGINRVSMGAQTFNDRRLRFLHRRHTAEQVAQAVRLLREAGIQNISVDLMYGFPNETIDEWQQDINAVLDLQVEHISAYCLMIEEGTPLYKLMHKGDGSRCAQDCVQENRPQNALNEELERQMYEVLIDKLTSAGYEHYEISNFALPGYHSQHNSSYWHDIPYIGLGAAAHSYDRNCRSWNVADIRQYIESIRQDLLPTEQEEIDAATHYNDCITTALRTSDGLDLTTLPDSYRSYCLQEAQRFLNDGLLRLHDNHLILTRKGLFVSDYILSDLIYA
jgi:oxygen-independent coproporphyrinogen-3 oxidase